jgi:uncharacterized protein (TIGR02328 family)
LNIIRIWHKDLIPVLPRQQLIGQWRECCLIAKSIAENGTPNHMLVNKVTDYPIEHFYCYTQSVFYEMIQRGYQADWDKFYKWYHEISNKPVKMINMQYVFGGWHDSRYYRQCFYNLQEKYDCGGIPQGEYKELVFAGRSRL